LVPTKEKEVEGEKAHDLEKPRCKLGSQARFQLKDPILLPNKVPNRFLRIWTLDPSIVGLGFRV
jgi:hypothetical protein